jgi:two-component system, LuxR family, response regulator FixJ
MARAGHPTTVAHVVAVVDDDPAVRHALKFSLEIEGFSVRAYGSAQELLEDVLLDDARLDDGMLADCACLVVDQNMPVINGLELIARLRGRAIAVPAILITTRPSATLRARAADAGVPIVEKPLLGNTLVDEIRARVA